VLSHADSVAPAVVQHARISGDGVLRARRADYKIGPLFADTEQVAEELLGALVAHYGGTPTLSVASLNGGVKFDETTLISATAVSSGATSAATTYLATAITNSPFRVVGFCDITEATAGTWATGPTTVQGCGGGALTGLSAFEFGQLLTNAAGSRTFGTTYTNTTSRPITVCVYGVTSSPNGYLTLTIGTIPLVVSSQPNNASGVGVSAVIPAGGHISSPPPASL